MWQRQRNEEATANADSPRSMSQMMLMIGAITAAMALAAPQAEARQGSFPSRMMEAELDSGVRANQADEPRVVYADVLNLGPDVPWARILFDREHTTLAAGSVIRVTSLLDGETHTLDAQELQNWGYGTAFFNGSTFIVQLVAAPNTVGNSVSVGRAFVGDTFLDAAPAAGTDYAGICGSSDTRQPRFPGDPKTPEPDPRVARWLPGEKVPEADGEPNRPDCTAFLVDQPGPDKLFITAGHCFCLEPGVNCPLNQPEDDEFPAFIVQFNVPPSHENCNIRHPPVKRQFAVRTDTVIANFDQDNNSGVGNDWAVFKCHPQEGMTPYERQGAAFELKEDPPGVGVGVDTEIIGYGVDGNEGDVGAGNPLACNCVPDAMTGQYNGVQQRSESTDKAPTVRIEKKEVDGVHTVFNGFEPVCPANSGSPVINRANGQVIAIVTHVRSCTVQCEDAPGSPKCKWQADCPDGSTCVASGEVLNRYNAIDHPHLQTAIEALSSKKVGCCWRKDDEGEVECNSPVHVSDCDIEVGWTFVAEKACGDPECGGDGPCDLIAIKLKTARDELNAAAALLAKLMTLINQPEPNMDEIAQKEQQAKDRLESSQALLAKAKGLIASLIKEGGAEGCPSVEKLDEILFKLSLIQMLISDAIEDLEEVMENPDMPAGERKHAYAKIKDMIDVAVDELDGPIAQFDDPTLVLGCCWHCKGNQTICENNVPEGSCNHNFVAGGQCGTNECGEGKCEDDPPPPPTGCCWRIVGDVLICNNNVSQAACQYNWVANRNCGDPECGPTGGPGDPDAIPTVSEWGLIILLLLLLVAGTIAIRRGIVQSREAVA